MKDRFILLQIATRSNLRAGLTALYELTHCVIYVKLMTGNAPYLHVMLPGREEHMTMKDVSSDPTAHNPVARRPPQEVRLEDGDESVDRMTLPETAALLVGDDANLQAQAARKVASIAAQHPATLAPVVPQLLAALSAWEDLDAHRQVVQALEAIAAWSIKPFTGQTEILRRTLRDQRSAAARAFAAQTLARLMVSDPALLQETWGDLAHAIEHQANTHQVDDMLEGIRILAGSPPGRLLHAQIHELVDPFTEHWKPQVQAMARRILEELERNAVLPSYLRNLKEQLAIFQAPPALPEVETPAPGPKYVSLRELCQLPLAEQIKAFRPLIPTALLTNYEIDEQTLRDRHGEPALRLSSSVSMAMVELTLWRQRADQDPALLLHFGETANGQIQIYLVVVNNLDAERFNIDYDSEGRPTLLGVVGRNLAEEARAMHAGLAPGQVRAGLGVMGHRLLPRLEKMLTEWGKQYLFAQPLAYHNAILLEHWGFFYLTGQRFMEDLDRRFKEGDLRARLDGSTFRPADAWMTARGRSWAIHDGIMDEPWPELHMARRIGHSSQVSTFSGVQF
jgi:hypothetical protein